MNFPSKLVENAVSQLSSLPGIGRKSALRLVLHMLRKDKVTIEEFNENEYKYKIPIGHTPYSWNNNIDVPIGHTNFSIGK